MLDSTLPRGIPLSGLPILAVLLACLTPMAARADHGEVALGVMAAGSLPAALGGELGVRFGATDSLSLEARGGALRRAGRTAAAVDGGVLLSWDVLLWVPQLRVAAGVEAESGATWPRFTMTVGARRYLSLDTAATLEAGAQWMPSGWAATCSLGVWLDLL
ncbi:MAG: hypothetical protein HY903_09350 [Deltaproteobacteria bacterium]|nr:hypothetical protein [Deltaproteobacteria bacterium]